MESIVSSHLTFQQSVPGSCHLASPALSVRVDMLLIDVGSPSAVVNHGHIQFMSYHTLRLSLLGNSVNLSSYSDPRLTRVILVLFPFRLGQQS